MTKDSDFRNNISQEESLKILKLRTKEISIPVSEIDSNIERLNCLNFNIQNTGYVISIKNVHGVISSFKMTKIPDIPDFILGITDYRGKILAIFDFHLFLGYSNTKIDSDSRLILVSHNNTECGILVNKVYNVYSIPLKDLEKNISTVEENISKYLNGMLRINKRLFALIDIPKVFESEKIKQLKDLSYV